MMLSRLARLSVLSLLLGRSSGIESPPANDAGALKNTVREVVDLLDDGATLASSQGDSSVWWNSGEFTFERSQVAVPSGQAQAYWSCSGGREGIYNRLMLFAPNVTYDEIAIDTDTWQDPIVEAWNATLNGTSHLHILSVISYLCMHPIANLCFIFVLFVSMCCFVAIVNCQKPKQSTGLSSNRLQ